MAENTGFFSSLTGLDAAEALERCKDQADEWRGEVEGLLEKLAQTPRGDKQGAHAIKQEVLRVRSKLQRLKPIVSTYRAEDERRKAHCLWADAVRAVCGQPALTDVYAWMKTEKKRRAQQADDARHEALEREHLGDPLAKTGIYATEQRKD